MWDSPLFAINMFYCHWLIKKLLLVNGLTKLIQAARDIRRKKSQREKPCNCPQETDAPEPCQ